MTAIKRACTKCSGTGVIQAFAHVAGGTCFDCKGLGYHVTTEAQEKRRKAAAKRNARQREARAEAYVRGRIQRFKEAGASYDEYHAESCHCGDPDGPGHGTTRQDYEEA